jgi:RHS repeat-associated protein
VEDAATSLIYMQQRYYDAGIGRFLSVDPVTAYEQPVINFNRYVYALNNPYKFTDPDGREVTCDRERCTGTIRNLVDAATVAVAYATAWIASTIPSSQNNEAADSDGVDAGLNPDEAKEVTDGAIAGIREGKMHAPGDAGKAGELIGHTGAGDDEWTRLGETQGAVAKDENNIRFPDGSNANRHKSTRPFAGGPPAGTDTIKIYRPGSRIPDTTVRYP